MAQTWTGPFLSMQVATCAAALIALTLWPPASGAMLLVPLDGENVGVVATLAVASGAKLLGKGPLPGSLVVVGDRAAIIAVPKAAPLLIVAAPPAACGSPDAAAAAAI